MNPRRHSLFTCTRRVRRRGLELKPRVLSELGTSAAGATESSARWPTCLVACTLAVDERTRAAPVKPVKSRLLTRYNAAAVVLQATHAEEAYGPRLQFLSRVVGCSADVRLRAKERPRCAGSLSLRSLDVERHRGSPRRLSTEVFAVPPHNLNRRPHECHRVVFFSTFGDDDVTVRDSFCSNGPRPDRPPPLGTQARRAGLDRY